MSLKENILCLKNSFPDFQFHSTCKELRCHHSTLTTSKNLNGMKIKLFLDPWESKKHRADHYPQDWRDRQVNTGATAYRSRYTKKPLREPVLGRKNLNCNGRIAGSSVKTCQWIKNLRGPDTGEDSTILIYLQKLNYILIVNIVNTGEKLPHTSGREWGKGNLKYTRELCFSYQGLISGEYN